MGCEMPPETITAPEAQHDAFTLDASDPMFYAQPNAADAYAWIHEHCPVYWCEAKYTEPFWNVCRDDLVSRLVGDMADEEVRSWLWLIFTGGVETTGNLLAGGAHLLLTHPDEKRKVLDDPSRWPSAVAEMLRLISPSRCVKRVAMDSHELGGCQIQAGQAVLMNYKVANVDPALYPDPMRFNVDRNPSQMVAFGNGPHRCPGNVIARLEIVVAFQKLFERFPNLELNGDIVIRPTLSTVVVESLPVVLKD